MKAPKTNFISRKPRKPRKPRSDRGKVFEARTYSQPSPEGFQGYIQDKDKTWILFLQPDGRAVFFSNRDEDGSSTVAGVWSEKKTKKKERGLTSSPSAQEEYSRHLAKQDEQRFLDGVCHLIDREYNSPLSVMPGTLPPTKTTTVGCGLPKNHQGKCDPNPPSNISWLALWRLGKTHFPDPPKWNEPWKECMKKITKTKFCHMIAGHEERGDPHCDEDPPKETRWDYNYQHPANKK